MPKIYRSLFLLVTLPLVACGTPNDPGTQDTSGATTTPSTQPSTFRRFRNFDGLQRCSYLDPLRAR